MTENEAIEWVYDQDESQSHDAYDPWWDTLEAAFIAIVGRKPTAQEEREGVWSHLCAMTPNCGTRPDTT